MAFERNQETREKAAESFLDEDVANAYLFRPPYPDELLKFLSSLADFHERAMDIGCGSGKISIFLSHRFGEVIAIDPSAAMIAAEKKSAVNCGRNITWVTGRAEDYSDDRHFGIITAGSSIHWTNHEILFPKLATMTGTLAIISNDMPRKPPCDNSQWREFISRWLWKMSEKDPTRWNKYDPEGFKAEANRHEKFMDIRGRMSFRQVFRQKVPEIIEMQHSQATWARKFMGEPMSRQFDEELQELILPCAEKGILEMETESMVVWGKPRSSAIQGA